MRYNISDQRLKVIVDELGEEYKDLLVERILGDMREMDADLINPSDLIRLDVATKATLRNDKKTQKQNRMLSLTSMMGIVYAFFGLMLMMWSEFSDIARYDSFMMMAFVLVFVGLFIALFSMLFKSMIKMRPHNYRREGYEISSYQIINKWKEIEALINELTPDGENLSLFSMVTVLKDIKIISDQDIELIDKLLSVRTHILHGNDNELQMSQSELRRILIQADNVIAKMKKLV
ncbi:MAG: hypothetical protein IJX86_05900 [Lachnospiraceae bacterium]|nr:hypothetical protein [Lachnospiraceae bacterium]